MSRKLLFLVAAVVCAITLESAPAQAEWLEDATPVVVYSGYQIAPMVVSDGEGGAIIGWADQRTGSYDVYAARIGPYGDIVWGPIVVCGGFGDQSAIVMASDCLGGAVFAWMDMRNGMNMDIFAQRVDSDGTILWTPDGEPVCTAGDDQAYPAIAGDGEGGAVICWIDNRDGDYNVYAQRLNYNGSNVFVSNGVSACSALYLQSELAITTDGKKGMYIVWRDQRDGAHWHLYAQRVDYIGNLLLTPDGNPIFTLGYEAHEPQIAFDGVGGAIIVWYDDRNSYRDMFAQRVRSVGSVEWKVNGEEITNAIVGHVQDPDLVTDGLGGSFVAWSDGRSGTWNLYAQRIDVNGHMLWMADGIKVVTGDHVQINPSIAFDGDDGLLVVWEDYRNDQCDIYAQRLNENGQPLWGSSGVPVCTYNSGKYIPQCVTDGLGGLITAWEDFRNYNYDVFVQRVERNGNWGYPSAYISSVQDISGDQGGSVNISWDASRLDPWPEELITQYTIWRAIEEPAFSAMFSSGALLVDDIETVELGILEQAVRVQYLAGETYYWKLVSTVDAYHLWGYSEIVPTLQDSTGEDGAVHYFQVIAHTNDPSEYWISPPDSGWSVDNLAPCPPLGLAAEQSYVPEGLTLMWEPNAEIDLSHYNVYRGDDIGFVPDPGSLLACTPDTNSFDGDWHWDNRYCYKVAAVDIHGNESEYAVLLTEEVTGDETPPAASFLGQNYPNPFNPMTTISFGLSEPGHVSLRIYDAAGRLVRALIDEKRPAGRYDEIWDGADDGGREAASGIYFYLLRAGDFKGTKKMVLLR